MSREFYVRMPPTPGAISVAVLRDRWLRLEADDVGLRAMHPERYDPANKADCVEEMRAEHDADVRRMSGDE